MPFTVCADKAPYKAGFWNTAVVPAREAAWPWAIAGACCWAITGAWAAASSGVAPPAISCCVITGISWAVTTGINASVFRPGKTCLIGVSVGGITVRWAAGFNYAACNDLAARAQLASLPIVAFRYVGSGFVLVRFDKNWEGGATG